MSYGDEMRRPDRMFVTLHMPPFRWTCVQLVCRSCEQRSDNLRDGERWPTLTRDELRTLEATELHCGGGTVILCVRLLALCERFTELHYHLFHAIHPMWDAYWIARDMPEVLGVQRLPKGNMKPLDDFSFTQEDRGGK